MGVEAHVADGARIVGEWSLDTNYQSVNMAANSWYDIASVAFAAQKDHDYLIEVTATGFMYGNATDRVKYAVYVDATQIVEHDLYWNSSTWDALISVPVSLAGVYHCTADLTRHVLFRHWKLAAHNDWLLDEGHHRMTVLDLGVQS